MHNYININKLKKSLVNFKRHRPFSVAVVDGFFNKKIINALHKEFPKYNFNEFYKYNNPVENKKALNNWNSFPSKTYEVFNFLNSQKFVENLSRYTKIKKLFPDIGLHGGGWHAMGKNGKLNPHLDYSIHPKLKLKRKLNLIIFLNKNWKKHWGGKTQFYTHDKTGNSHSRVFKEVLPKFNRAVLFDTSKNSWHAVSKVNCSKKNFRKSLAIYYLTNPTKKTNKRKKALYSLFDHQKKNKKLVKFVERRSKEKSASKVYIY